MFRSGGFGIEFESAIFDKPSVRIDDVRSHAVLLVSDARGNKVSDNLLTAQQMRILWDVSF